MVAASPDAAAPETNHLSAHATSRRHRKARGNARKKPLVADASAIAHRSRADLCAFRPDLAAGRRYGAKQRAALASRRQRLERGVKLA
jgi:hypothetical protein